MQRGRAQPRKARKGLLVRFSEDGATLGTICVNGYPDLVPSYREISRLFGRLETAARLAAGTYLRKAAGNTAYRRDLKVDVCD